MSLFKVGEAGATAFPALLLSSNLVRYYIIIIITSQFKKKENICLQGAHLPALSSISSLHSP